MLVSRSQLVGSMLFFFASGCASLIDLAFYDETPVADGASDAAPSDGGVATGPGLGDCGQSVCAISCAPAETDCGGVCRTLASDPANCGACNHVCGPGDACAQSKCVTQISIVKAGKGRGSVSSTTPGIDCGAACGGPFTPPLTLQAAPESGSFLSGWSGGGCSGIGTCEVTTSATITATFKPLVYVNSPTTLYSMNTDTGVVTPIAPFSSGVANGVLDLALDSKFNLYIVMNDATVRPVNKVDATVGPPAGTGQGYCAGATFAPDPATGLEALYAVCNGSGGSTLIRVDVSNGTFTAVGALGLTVSGDILVAASGSFVTVIPPSGDEHFARIDLATAKVTLVGPTNVGPTLRVFGLAEAEGQVLAFAGVAGVASPTIGQKGTIDLNTGAVTLAPAALGFSAYGAASLP